jgi:hypothetical protein
MKLENLLKKRKVLKHKFDQKVKETINIDDINFDLKPIRNIRDIRNSF